jgi:hypothetical protein
MQRADPVAAIDGRGISISSSKLSLKKNKKLVNSTDILTGKNE